jgi:hypothetical protein
MPAIARIGAKPRGGIGLDRIDDVEKVMRHPRARRRVGFRRPDVHAAIDLGGIDADDLDREALGERHCERRLAGPGGPHQQNGRSHWSAPTLAAAAAALPPEGAQ